MSRTSHTSVLLLVLFAVACAPDARAADVTLSLRATGAGAAVSLTPTGVLTGCAGMDCKYRFPEGAWVLATANPSVPGSSFARWLGACRGASPVCSLKLDRNKRLIGRFSPVMVHVDRTAGRGSVSFEPEGSPCGDGCWSYPYGSNVTLTATPAPDYVFNGWDGVCPANARAAVCQATTYADIEPIPFFITSRRALDCPVEGCPLGGARIERIVEASIILSSRRGYIQANGSLCRSSCRRSFKRGRPIVLKAYPRPGSTFKGWSGACSSPNTRCQFAAFRGPDGLLPRVVATFG